MTHNLNLVPGKVPVAVHVKQYDTGPREVTFNLYYGDTVYTIPSSVTITVSGTKPDGNGFAYNVTGFSGSTVTVPMQEQMTVLAGEIPCQLTIAQTSGVIGTATFTLCVEPAALSSDTPVSDTELAAFQEMLTQTQQEAAGVAGATAQIATNTSNIATNTAAISQLNSKNYTVISSGQTIDVLTYARSLGRGQHNVYCAASTVTGGPTTDACLYEFFVQGNGLVYVRATRWTSTAANRNVWDAIINGSTSSIAWRQMPSQAEIDSLNSKWVIETKTLSVPNIAAGGTEWVTSAIAKAGYTAVGAVGWYFAGGTANSFLFPYSMRVAVNNVNVAIRNLGTTASSGVSLQIDVLYQKN